MQHEQTERNILSFATLEDIAAVEQHGADPTALEQLDYKDQVRAAPDDGRRLSGWSQDDVDGHPPSPQQKCARSFLGSVPFAQAELVPAEDLVAPSPVPSFDASSGMVSVPVPSKPPRRFRCRSREGIVILIVLLLVALAAMLGTSCTASGCFQSSRTLPSTPSIKPAPSFSNWTEIGSHDLAEGDAFGGSVAVHQDTIVVGAFLKDDHELMKPGSAYAFRKTASGSWEEEQKLQPNTPVENSRFGRSVAVHGERIAVGAYFDDHAGAHSGSAYVFRRENGLWIEDQKIIPDNATADSLFGISIAIHEDQLYVGAPNENNKTGSVYNFARDATTGRWNQQQKLVAFDASPGDSFGKTIAIDDRGNTVVVGSVVAGGAHVFVRARDGVFVELEKLRSDSGTSGDYFVRSVGVSGDTVAVGADTLAVGAGEQATPEDHGAVYLFRVGATGWVDYQMLRLPESSEHARFGSDLAISEDSLVVTARYGNEGDSATIHVYSRVGDDTWEESFTLTESMKQNDFRRVSLALDNSTLVAGSAYGTTTHGSETGTVFVCQI